MVANQGDELFSWFNLRYNVTKIRAWVNAHPEIQPCQFGVKLYAEFMLAMQEGDMEPAGVMMNINWDHVRGLTADALEKPILGVMTQYGVLFIDGNHRIAKAYQIGQDELPSLILTQAQVDAATQPASVMRLKVRTLVA